MNIIEKKCAREHLLGKVFSLQTKGAISNRSLMISTGKNNKIYEIWSVSMLPKFLRNSRFFGFFIYQS